MADYAAMSHDARCRRKDVGGFVGGKTIDGSRKSTSIIDRQLICLDADYANADLYPIWMNKVGKQVVIHSTHSSTPDNLRLRLIIPLSRPVDIEEYEPVARYLAYEIGIDAFDDTTYDYNRLMYWPSLPDDAEYYFRTNDDITASAWVDPDEILARYENWHDVNTWPFSSREKTKHHQRRAEQGDPRRKPGCIGAFNRVYTISEAI